MHWVLIVGITGFYANVWAGTFKLAISKDKASVLVSQYASNTAQANGAVRVSPAPKA